MSVKILPIPALSDNYIWTLLSSDAKRAVLIDPGDDTVAQQALEKHKVILDAILITHRHWDHVTGVNALRSRWQCPVYGPCSDAIPQVTHPLHEGDTLSFWGELDFTVWETPGHTTEHISYLLTDASPPKLFCGDTLFAAGCGRLLGGTAEQLYNSLQRFCTLPESTEVYCTHEYTQSNLKFAEAVEPTNNNIKSRKQIVENKRNSHEITLPTNLAEEKRTNPFLRCNTAAVLQRVNEESGLILETPDQVFAQLRRWKDAY